MKTQMMFFFFVYLLFFFPLCSFLFFTHQNNKEATFTAFDKPSIFQMLEKFPNEIVELIVPYLKMSDLISCKQVSKQWRGKIANASLIKQFSCFTQMQFNKFLAFCDVNGLDGSIVKKLSLHFPPQQPMPLASLPIVFPNIEELSLTYRQGLELKEVDLGFYESWGLRLRHFETNYIEGIVPDLFKRVQFQRLTSLIVYFHWPNSRYRDVDTFAKYLTFIPTLESLKIVGFIVHLSHLELLHDSTPRLTSLNLSEGVICFHESPMPNIQPAKMITSLTIESHANVNEVDYMSLEYIALKYPNLTSLTFNPCLDAFVSPTFIYDGGYTNNFLYLTSTFSKQFKSLTVNSYLFRQDILKEFDKRKIQLHHLSIISPNTSLQQHLILNTPCDYDQLNHIRDFTINNLNIKYCFSIKNMVQLQELNLINCYGLESLFDYLPCCLKSLKISTNTNLSTLISKNPAALHQLTQLSIKGKDLESVFVTFISRVCPRLVSFHLTDTSFRFKSRLFMPFPQRTLKEFRLQINDCFSYFTTQTSKGTKHFGFFIDRNGGKIDRLKNSKYVNFSFIIKCRKNPEIWLNNHLVI